MKRWQEDKAFGQWLLAKKYARDEGGLPVPCISLGLVLYMWEAWTAGRQGPI